MPEKGLDSKYIVLAAKRRLGWRISVNEPFLHVRVEERRPTEED